MDNAGFEISLFGSCVVRRNDASRAEITGAKHRALFALLVTAPLNRRSRTFLQETLWGFADYEAGHQNLRRALSDLRKKIGPCFDDGLGHGFLRQFAALFSDRRRIGYGRQEQLEIDT